MATVSAQEARRDPLAPHWYEVLLAIGAAILLAAIVAALIRGHGNWERAPFWVWPHLGTIMIATALTPVMLLRRKGDAPHRLMGKIWVISMVATALFSFNLRGINQGGFSPIHLLSIFTLFIAPLIWWGARTHNVRLHRRAIRGTVTGALLIAGFFTFPFDRLLGHWLFG